MVHKPATKSNDRYLNKTFLMHCGILKSSAMPGQRVIVCFCCDDIIGAQNNGLRSLVATYTLVRYH